MTKNRNKIYPGMIDNSVEFFVFNDQLNAIQNGVIKNFTDFSFSLISLIKEEMETDEAALEALMQMHPGSNLRRIEQFTKCRFGGLDGTPDIKDGVIGEGDYWDCPVREHCQFNGTICKAPQYNGQELTPVDIEIMKSSATTKTNEVIAEEIGVPYGTFHKIKQNLYSKLEVQTKQEVAVIAVLMNFI